MKVLYGSPSICLDDTPDDEIPTVPKTVIENDDFEMAIAMMEYFQGECQAYEKVYTSRTSYTQFWGVG